jgi:phenylpropionate dioxygenase-like ring-hydroxylating dioxygenase large terminal subunit
MFLKDEPAASCRLATLQALLPFPGGDLELSFTSQSESATRIADAEEVHLNDPLLLGQWFLVAWSGEVGPGRTLAYRALGRDLVLWRSSEGLHCWLDLCIHRGARLSLGAVRDAGGAGECLVCPYHAWEYGPSGQCIRIPAHPGMKPPAKARAQVFHVKEKYGAVWVCLGEPQSEPPDFDLAEITGFRTIPAGPYVFRALGPRVIENVLDVAHLGYVHAGLLGDPENLEMEDYEVIEGQRGPEAKEIRIWQPNPDGTGKGALVTYRYWVAGPLTVGLEKISGNRRFGILTQVTPLDAEYSAMRMLMCINHGEEIADEELRAFQDKVAEQDRVVVESQRPELLPLDLQEELHLRSDRMAIAYRKWLRKIGLRYGAA